MLYLTHSFSGVVGDVVIIKWWSGRPCANKHMMDGVLYLEMLGSV